MKNKGVILLGMVVILLSFLVFDGGNNITGQTYVNGVVVPSFLVEKEEINLEPDVTYIHCGRNTARRGQDIPCRFIPGKKGMLTEAGLYDSQGNVKYYFYLCGYGNKNKVCSAVTNRGIEFPRTATRPGEYTVKVYDVGTKQYVSKSFTIT